MKRIFSVRVNIDDVSASLDAWPSDQERSAWLRGFIVGSRGVASRWTSGPEADGHSIGAAGYADSIAWREKKIAAGKASADARMAGLGTSNPRACREHDVNDVGTQREQCSQNTGTHCEPSSHPVIQSSNSQSSENHIPAAPPVAKAPRVKTEAEVLIAKHPFKISGPKRDHKTAVNQLLKFMSAEKADQYLEQTEPLWPDRLIHGATVWLSHLTSTPSTRPKAPPINLDFV